MNSYELLNLYPHNIKTCKKIKQAFDNGENIVSIIKATGTGKSYVGLNLALENNDKKTIWLVPSNAIKEHIEQIIFNNPNLSKKKNFPNLEIRTYSSLVNLSDEEIENIDCDLLIVDELHHIGAPVWGEKVNTLIYTHKNILTFGMSAYSVRDRGTSYERDMTNPDTEEIFSDTVVDRYDLYDAIIDGVLPLPITKTVLTENSSIFVNLHDALKLNKMIKNDNFEIEIVLDAIIKNIHNQDPIKKIIQDSVEDNGKYIYFCPVLSYEGINDIETIREQVVSYIKETYPDKKIVAYQTTSDMGTRGEKNRYCFYHDLDLDGKDVSDTIRIMFAKNQYNEGVHAPNIDGVFLGRKTGSDIVALEQIGRALSVRDNIDERRKEYNLLSLKKLKEIAKNKKIIFDENITKEHLIELLVSPMIIDLTGNVEFLEELETNLKDRVREKTKDRKLSKTRLIFLKKYSLFMVEQNQKKLISALLNLNSLVKKNTWDKYYELALAYYQHYGNSEIPSRFKTNNGIDYDDNGISLGIWCMTQRSNSYKLSEDRHKKLEQIGFRFENKITKLSWEEWYNLSLAYYQHYGNSEIPSSFKTNNGIDYDDNGFMLGAWCNRQRFKYKINKLGENRINKLKEINFRFLTKGTQKIEWDKYYDLAVIYFNYHGNSEIPQKFKTVNGFEYDINGICLGQWCNGQRCRYKEKKLEKDRIDKLNLINFRFEDNIHYLEWIKMYALAVAYYNHHGNSEITFSFRTKNGIDYDDNGFMLGAWCNKQRYNYNNLDEEKINKLNLINFRFQSNKYSINWQKSYELVVNYFKHYGNSEVPRNFKSSNGIDNDDNGIDLGVWCDTQRRNYNNLDNDRINKLNLINFRFENNKRDLYWKTMYELAIVYFNHHGHSEIPDRFKTKNGIDYDDNGFNLGNWCTTQRYHYKNKKLEKDRIEKLEKIYFRFEEKKKITEEKKKICNIYNIEYNSYKILDIMPYQELYAKIMFLIDNNLPIEENSKLHEIFSMSNENMILKHMISKEELINKYYIKKKEKNI